MRRLFMIPIALFTLGLTPVLAQQAGRARLDDSRAAQRPQVDPELWQVLTNWSQKSGGVQRLEGEIVRRTYDFAFGVERIGTGYFYYESPDKGRLDLAAVEINPAMLKARQAKGARVRRKPDGTPYTLESDAPEKWVCDGERIINMNVQNKTAMVLKLLEEQRGRNIMNGPLPFLFGLPPDEAVDRFHLELLAAPTAKNPMAKLRAKPKRPADAQAWKVAEVFLDTRTGLPAHVRLINPAESGEEVYSFRKLKSNARVGGFLHIFTRNPFKVDLSKYQVDWKDPNGESPAQQQIGAAPQQARVARGGPVVPNLVGMSHKEAEAALNRLGVSKKNVKMRRGHVARKPQDVYRVESQSPAPGTPIKDKTRVALDLWIKAKPKG